MFKGLVCRRDEMKSCHDPDCFVYIVEVNPLLKQRETLSRRNQDVDLSTHAKSLGITFV